MVLLILQYISELSPGLPPALVLAVHTHCHQLYSPSIQTGGYWHSSSKVIILGLPMILSRLVIKIKVPFTSWPARCLFQITLDYDQNPRVHSNWPQHLQKCPWPLLSWWLVCSLPTKQELQCLLLQILSQTLTENFFKEEEL